MTCPVYDKSFHEGVLQFLQFAEDNQYNPNGLYRCPCRRCSNTMIMDKQKIYYHLTSNGILPHYTVWDLHGEVTSIPSASDERMEYLHNMASSSNSFDPAVQFVHDAFPFREQYFHGEEQVTPNPDLEHIGIAATKKYDNLIKATETLLYYGSSKTTLGALLEVMSLKERKGMNDSTFTEVVDLCKRTLPEPNTYPESYAAAKKALKDVGMGYEVFDACVNSCHLYYKEGAIFDQCPVCGTLRYTKNDGKKIPRKQVRYFPLTPRLQRLYMSQRTACEMRWHGQREKDPNDDVLRHPADGEAWKDFDR